jgi:kynurenine formamidase
LDFFPAYCLDIPKNDDECVSGVDIESRSSGISDARALLIRTGYSRYRDCDTTRYTSLHPWIHPDLPEVLRKTFPELKLVCFDLLSVSVPGHRAEGRLCHRAFLCTDTPILLMEDADLSGLLLAPSRYHLWIHPWIIEDTDGVPVAAFVTEK